MKINKKLAVIGALFCFVIASLWAFWPSLNAESVQQPQASVTASVPIDSSKCIAPTEYMRSHHMQILNEWRNSGARDPHPYVAHGGQKFQKSLNTCLGCHGTSGMFCFSCHEYAHAKPNCWNCHLSPKEQQ